MTNARNQDRIIQLELEVLHRMCNGSSTIAQTEGARHALRDYTWRNEEHRVVFEALGHVRSGDIIPLREQLPAHATRMGFPDVDWNLYFEPPANQHRSPTSDLHEAVRELLLETNTC